jgi:hypothetical protein
MSYGLSVLNDAGNIAFTTNYPCFSFIGKYVVTRILNAGDFPGALTGNYCSLDVTSVNCPLVFVAPNNANDSVKVISAKNNGNGTWTIRFTALSIQSGNIDSPSNLTTLTAYVFSSDNIAATGYGINVYSSSGSVNFSTARKALKISGKIISPQYNQLFAEYYDSALSTGVIPTSWAASSQSIGFRLQGLDPGANYGIAISIGVSALNSTTVRYKSSCALGTVNFVSAINIYGGSYTMFIDTSLYN